MRILCLPYTHTLSHISRPLLIARELRSRGHKIIFAGDSPCQHFIENEGFEVLPLYQIPPGTLFGRIRDGRLKFVEDAELERMVREDCECIATVKPELIISDGRFSAPISTKISGVNHAAIVNVSSTEYRARPYIPFFDWLPGSLNENRSVIWRMLDRINLTLEMFVFDNAATIFKLLSRRYKLPRTITATNCLAGNGLVLLSDIEEYFPTRNLPDNYHYIGPLTWRSTLPPPGWWPPRRSREHLVYFTMGTTWMGQSLEFLYEGLKTHDITAILSTGGQTGRLGVDALRSVEGELYIEDFVDGDLVMTACDAVVCHGGNGTIYQALKHGKPIVGIPTIPDQAFNMRRVTALGVGETLAYKDLAINPERLFEKIRQVSRNPLYKKNAERFREILCGMDPASKGADLIEEYCCRNRRND